MAYFRGGAARAVLCCAIAVLLLCYWFSRWVSRRVEEEQEGRRMSGDLPLQVQWVQDKRAREREREREIRRERRRRERRRRERPGVVAGLHYLITSLNATGTAQQGRAEPLARCRASRDSPRDYSDGSCGADIVMLRVFHALGFQRVSLGILSQDGCCWCVRCLMFFCLVLLALLSSSWQGLSALWRLASGRGWRGL